MTTPRNTKTFVQHKITDYFKYTGEYMRRQRNEGYVFCLRKFATLGSYTQQRLGKRKILFLVNVDKVDEE